MKRKLFILISLFILLCTLNAQSKNSEGFDGFSWNTTVSEFLKKYPSVKETTASEDFDRNERVFQRDANTVIRVYRFFDDKLYWGRTVYKDPDYDTELAIVEKLVETYGEFDDSDEWTENGNDYYSLVKFVSPTLSIEATEVYYYNSYGRIIKLNVFITYENTKTRREVDNYSKNKKKKNIEL